MNSGVDHRRVAILAVFAGLFCCPLLRAEAVSPEQVRRAADVFLRMRQMQSSKVSPWLATSRTSRTVRDVNDISLRPIRDADGTILAYVVELEPQGFVVTSADTDLEPIVAYSFRSGFPDQVDVRHPMYCLLAADMRSRLAAADESDASQTTRNNAQWAAYSVQRSPMAEGQTFQQWPPENTTSTGGWLETAWEQDAPYNAFCPLDPVDGLRSYVGCVATAMAQVLHYHRRCGAVFDADDAYTTVSGIDIDADHVRYDFPSLAELNEALALVRFKYEAQADLDDADVAALSFACGVAARMDYSSEGSGASAYDMAAGMVEEFGLYSADLADDLSEDTARLLRENLANRLPAILGIHTPDGMAGHAVVCDGYNTNGEYHLNFGWGRPYPAPIAEAWYRLPVDIPHALNAISAVLINIRPTAPQVEVRPGSLSFRGVPGQPSEPLALSLQNASTGTLSVDSITCPAGFVASRTGDGYTDRIGSFRMSDAGQKETIHVRFHPESAGTYYGLLGIGYGDGQIKYVPLSGAATVGGTRVESGRVSGTWSEAASPYYVYGDIEVAPGSELIIEPGTRVEFTGRYSLTVGRDARLLARGTAERPVEFTAGNRELGWSGIRFVSSGDDDVLRHCSITFARNGMETSGSDLLLWNNPVGGAVCCNYSSPTITHCKITNNTCVRAGAIYCLHSSAAIRNTLVANNTCVGGEAQSGGVCCYLGSAVRIDNCTIVNNVSGGIFSQSELGTELTNSIVWGNSNYQIESYESEVSAAFCDVQGGYEGEGNIDSYPCFLEPSDDAGADQDASGANWTLQMSSPCINAGSGDGSGGSDLAGNVRVHSGVIDMGAYENQLDLPLIDIRPGSSVEFGCVPVDANAVSTVKITNTGQIDFQVIALNLSDPRDVFSVLNPVSKFTLSPGQSIEVRIGFAPQAERVYSAVLHITSTSTNSPYRRIALRGTGGLGTLVPGGPVGGVWTKAAGPYTVTGDIEVPEGQTLTVEPGVVVRFAGHYGLTVGRDATLHAAGVEHDPVLFSAIDTIEGWFGIRLVSSGDDDVLRYCHIEHANKPYGTAAQTVDLVGGAVLCCKARNPLTGRVLSGPASSPVIDHCRFSNNHAESGGAIACREGSQAVITNNTIVGNTADWEGGGIHIYSAAPTISNNVVAGNSAYWGGGLYNLCGQPAVINNTIVRNRPNGLHLGSTWGLTWGGGLERACLVNNIVWENELYFEEDILMGPGLYDVRFNDVQGGIEGEGNIEADPLFADSANGDYHLKSAAGRWDTRLADWVIDTVTSPCIDAGDPSSDPLDEPALNGGRINMGAYGGTPQASKSP